MATCLGSDVCQHASRYTPQVGRAIVRGLLRTTLRKETDRLRRLITALDQRIRGEGVRVPEEGVETLRWLRSQELPFSQLPMGCRPPMCAPESLRMPRPTFVELTIMKFVVDRILKPLQNKPFQY